MSTFILSRYKFGATGTFGKLHTADGQFLCYTCERPWDNNKPDTSCIPQGKYMVIPHNSIDHPNTWEITQVPNRREILIHNGNIETQSEGCILVGDSLGEVNGLPAVLNSVQTLNMLRSKLPSTFTLEVSNAGVL